MEQTIDLDQGQPEFNQDELDSLQVGEELLEQEEQMLAGKFKDAEELEKAYIELQRKLGSKDEPEETEEVRDEAPTEEVEPEEYSTEQWITEAAAEWGENGFLSEETLQQIAEMNPADLAEAFMGMQSSVEDLSEADTSAIKQVAGGDQGYEQMISWASESMPPEYINSFNQLCNSGDAYSIQLAVAGMRAAYEQQNGYEGRMLTGEAAESRPDGFRSQAEVLQAMSDPRYDSDPAYRNDVFAKLERSNIDF